MPTKLEALQQYFGYREFRQGQEEIIDAILSGRDTVGVLPTGGGKSLCFQLPALLMPGITLVVSPLISLMKDQVAFLAKNGICGAYLNSSLTYRQYRAALYNAKEGRYKIIYLAPERLHTPEFLEFAKQAQISMVTVDEAHCISQWGQDFRPSYLKIASFLKELPYRPVVSAFTATATPKVREDICSLLSLREPYLAVTSFYRKNLSFKIQKTQNKLYDFHELMEKYRGKSGIVYCITRKSVRQLCFALQLWGFPATRYHAGLSSEERKENQEDFISGKSPIMVATSAFGMGIDKPDVSFVIHYHMPKDLESYYQEAGRAGRNGEKADCILLYDMLDESRNRYLLYLSEEKAGLSPEMKEVVVRQNEARLQAMAFFCHTSECLNHYILRYFGEQFPTSCGTCSNCHSSFQETDITKISRKILRHLKKLPSIYEIWTLCDLFLGIIKRVRRIPFSFHEKRAYGIFKELDREWLREVVFYLVHEGYLSLAGRPNPVLSPGERAQELENRKHVVTMKMPVKPAAPKAPPVTWKPMERTKNPELFKRLFDLRIKLALEHGIAPPYLILSNASLEAICERLPRTPKELLQITGVNEEKQAQYGEEFLDVVSQYVQEQGGAAKG